MIDIYSKKNSNGDTIVNTEIKNEREREELKKVRDYSGPVTEVTIPHINRTYTVKLPGINSEIKVDYSIKSTTEYAPYDKTVDYERVARSSSVITIDGETIKTNDSRVLEVGNGTAPDYTDEIKDYDLNKVVSAVVAYAYVKKNIRTKVIGNKTKEQLESLPTEELETLVNKIDKIMNEFFSATSKCTILIDKNIDSQKMLDEVFGKGIVDLDKLVEKQVDAALVQREIDKKNETEIAEQLAIRQAKIDKHKGILKLFTPIRMIKQKLEDIKLARKLRNQTKEEKRASEKAKRDEETNKINEEAKREKLYDKLLEM